jgi:hypothetical protein
VKFSPRAVRASIGTVIVLAVIVNPFGGAAQADPCPTSTSLTTGNESSVKLVIPEEGATPAPSACPTTATTLGSTGGSSSPSRGSGTKGSTAVAPGSASGISTTPVTTTSSSDGSAQGAPLLTLDHSSVAPNQWVLASGDGFIAAERVHFVLYPRAVDLGTFSANASGRITARFRIPADTRPGAHTIEATGATSHFVRNAPITVLSAGFAGELPYRWWISIVVGAVLLGILALVIYFRRRIAGWFPPSSPATGLAP